MLSLASLKRGLVVFWSVWFTLALVSNIFDALKALGTVPNRFPFASGNFQLVEWVGSRFKAPAWLSGALFAGVILWEGVATVLFWRAAASARLGSRQGLNRLNAAFTGSIGLWAAFLVADELFVAYETGVEGSHVRLFTAELASLLSVHLLPD